MPIGIYKRTKEDRRKISLALLRRWKDPKYRKSMTGKNNPFWKGGKTITRYGYVQVLRPNHPFNHNGYVFEHRIVMEKKIGRYLRPEERVHHINKIKTDNHPSNLELFPNHSKHFSKHSGWNKGKKFNGRPCSLKNLIEAQKKGG